MRTFGPQRGCKKREHILGVEAFVSTAHPPTPPVSPGTPSEALGPVLHDLRPKSRSREQCQYTRSGWGFILRWLLSEIKKKNPDASRS